MLSGLRPIRDENKGKGADCGGFSWLFNNCMVEVCNDYSGSLAESSDAYNTLKSSASFIWSGFGFFQ